MPLDAISHYKEVGGSSYGRSSLQGDDGHSKEMGRGTGRIAIKQRAKSFRVIYSAASRFPANKVEAVFGVFIKAVLR